MRVVPERLVQGSEGSWGRHPRRSLAPRLPGSGGVPFQCGGEGGGVGEESEDGSLTC
jgi:hypothetical protein